MGLISSRRARMLGAAIATFMTSVLAVAVAPSAVSAEPFTYTNVSTGYHAACAVTSTGEGVCWGWNYQRSLGTADTSEKVATPSRVALPNGERFAAIDAGEYFTTCGLSTTGNAYCWGQHHIGSYFTTTSTSPVRVELPAGVRVTQISNGSTIACAIDTGGQLWCWGDVLDFGNGSTEGTRTPERVPMPDGASVVSIENGPTHSCAITSAAHLYCWGSNDDGEIGLGYATLKVSTPTSPRVPAGVVPASVSAGLNRTCMLDTTGTGWCWGDNYEGSFGDGTYSDSYVPVRVVTPGSLSFTSLTTSWYHSCGVLSSGATHCWGRGGFGELGTGTTLGGKTFRQPALPEGVSLVQVSTGLATTCAIDASGRIWCWTGSDWGVAGTGDLTKSLFPRLIAPIGSPTNAIANVTDIGAETAVAHATVTPNGSATTVVAEVAENDTFTDARRVSSVVSAGKSLYTPSYVSITLGSLAPRMTHWVRTIATNQWGSVTSAATTFVTLGSEPTVSAPSVSGVSGTRATIAATIEPGVLHTSAVVEVSAAHNFADAMQFTLAPVTASGGVQGRSTVVSGLLPRTAYFARVSATNRLGTTVSEITGFVTIGALPQVTGLTTSASLTSISVTARVDGGALRGSVFAQISRGDSFDDATSSEPLSWTEGDDPTVTRVFTGLNPRTTYKVRVIAVNALGTHASAVESVRTRGGLPILSDVSATAIGVTVATVSAFVDTTGLPTSTKLQVADDPGFTTGLDEMFVGRHSHDGAVLRSVFLTGLVRRTTYYARFVSTNEAGTSVSGTTTFTTLMPVGVEINDGADTTVDTTVTLSFTHPASSVAVRVSDNPSMKGARVFDRVSEVQWTLPPSTEAETTRTVFVQFMDANGVASPSYSDSIVLTAPDTKTPEDDTAPEVTEARIPRVSTSSAKTAGPGHRLVIAGRDSFSGITAIQVRVAGTVRTIKVAATRSLHQTVVSPARTGVWVRLVDAAGNASRWRKVRVG